MTGRLRTSAAGLDLITRFEGFRPVSAELPGGGHVIGYGHTLHAKANQRITEEDARTLLRGHDLAPIEKAITARTLAPLSQNEFDALVAFAFNIGLENFLESDVFALVNSGAKLNAAEAMASWRKARVDGRVIVVDALVRRRAAERALFLEVPGGPTPVPTPLVRPILDLASAILHPREAARKVRAQDENDEGIVRTIVEDEDRPESGSPVHDETRVETAPEAAARSVTRRLSRILGDEAGLAPPVVPADSDSVEEITRAVSKLADAPDDIEDAGDIDEAFGIQPSRVRSASVEAKSLHDAPESDAIALPDADDDDADPLLALGVDRTDGQPNKPVVDDLEPVLIEKIVPEPIPEVSGTPAPMGSLLLYGAAAFGGALIGAWGLDNLIMAMSSADPLQSDWDLYAGPFALLVGGLIFLIMSYYLLRALLTEG